MNRSAQRIVVSTVSTVRGRIAGAFAGLLITIALAAPLHADEAGREAFVAGDYEKALDIWQPLAEDGDARAQFNVGLLYDEGLGVEKDPQQARQWWSKAAEQGLLAAGYNLALLELEQAASEDGEGDLETALAHLRQTAEAGHLPARYTLGKVYQYGIGVEEDREAAFENIRLAAEGGFAKAQYNLGKAYRDGDGVEQDAEKAVEWFRRAALRGHPGAQDHYARRLFTGEGVEKDPVQAMTFAVLAMRAGVDDAKELADDIRGELDISQLDEAFRAADGYAAASPEQTATQ